MCFSGLASKTAEASGSSYIYYMSVSLRAKYLLPLFIAKEKKANIATNRVVASELLLTFSLVSFNKQLRNFAELRSGEELEQLGMYGKQTMWIRLFITMYISETHTHKNKYASNSTHLLSDFWQFYDGIIIFLVSLHIYIYTYSLTTSNVY